MASENILFLIVIYGVGVWVLLHVSRTLLAAGAATPDGGPKTARTLVAGLWVWAVIATFYALMAGNHILWLLPSFLLPLTLVVATTFLSPVTALLRHASLSRLVGVQVYRVVGAVFLLSFFVFDGPMSRQFAVQAGWGDVLTGVLALPVALMVARRVQYWQLAVIGWCILGVGDLIMAPVNAQIYGGPDISSFPINAIPIFFGPPLGISLHVIALRILWLQRAGTRPEARPSPPRYAD